MLYLCHRYAYHVKCLSFFANNIYYEFRTEELYRRSEQYGGRHYPHQGYRPRGHSTSVAQTSSNSSRHDDARHDAVVAGGREYFVPEGNIYWIPSEMEHSMSSNNRQIAVRIYYLPIAFSELSPGSSFGVYTGSSWLSTNLRFIAGHGSRIDRRFHRTLYDYSIAFFRLLPDVGQKYQLPLKGISTGFDPKLREALHYIDDHLAENLRFDDVAEGIGMSSRSLSRLFKDGGISFSSYMNNHRIVRALEMMADKQMTMREISYATGFSSPTNFNRSFKQVIGMSPTQMREAAGLRKE